MGLIKMEKNNEQIEKMPELGDVVRCIYRYNTVHKDGIFVFRFIGFKKSPTEKCVDCGEPIDEYDDTKSLIGAYGYLGTLRMALEELRDTIEDEVDEDGFVNINEIGQANEE